MLLTTMTMPAIQDLVKKTFVVEAKRKGGDVRKLFHKATQDWKSAHKRIWEVDVEQLAERKTEGGNSAQRGARQGYFKDISRSTISITRKVSGEAYRALSANDLAKQVMRVAQDVIDKTELDMANVLSYGEATSYVDNGGFTIDTTVGDGKALFDTAHTLKYSSTTYSNILTGAPSLDDEALAQAEDYFTYNVMDNFGKRISMKPNTVITTSKAIMLNRVTRIFGSMSPESIEGSANANSGVVNTYRNKYQHLVVDFDVNALDETDATKSFYWALACLGGMPERSFQAYYVSWLSPMVAPAEVDQDKWLLSYTARSAYGLGAVSGKGIVLSKATS